MTSRRRRRHGAFSRLGWIVVCAAIGLVLLPYLLVPLYRIVPPVSTLMLARWLSGERVERQWVSIQRMSPALPLAVIAAEDARFCSHGGVDWQEIRSAIEEADDITEARGGSTITQQVAKNLFLWPGRSIVRKGLEFPLAVWIDWVLPKRRVLEIYLNVVEWGPNGEFGAEAASRWAFGKPVFALALREAALLASVLPNPRLRSAREPSAAVWRLAGIYERRVAGNPELAACIRPGRSH